MRRLFDKPKARSRAWWLAATSLGLTIVAVVGLFRLMEAGSPADAVRLPQTMSATTAVESRPVGSAQQGAYQFRQPEEARKFLKAVSVGNQRSIESLRDALERARQSGGADPQYIEELEALLRERQQQQAAPPDGL